MEVAVLFCKPHDDIKPLLLVGGTSVEEDVDRFRAGGNFLIATPGRLHDIMTHRLGHEFDTREMEVKVSLRIIRQLLQPVLPCVNRC